MKKKLEDLNWKDLQEMGVQPDRQDSYKRRILKDTDPGSFFWIFTPTRIGTPSLGEHAETLMVFDEDADTHLIKQLNNQDGVYGHYLGCDNNRTSLGFFQASQHEACIQLESIYVLPWWRNWKIGTYVIKESLPIKFYEEGTTHIRVLKERVPYDMLSFFDKAGFFEDVTGVHLRYDLPEELIERIRWMDRLAHKKGACD